MRTRASVSFLIFAAAILRAQNSYYLPQISDGAISTGSLRTTIAVVNHSSTTTANITITGTRDDASPATLSIPALGSGTTLSASLAPGAARLFTTDGSGDGSLIAGQLLSDIPIGVSAVISSVDVSGNVSSETYAPASSADELAAEYLLPVDTTGVLNTVVALYNPSSAATASVTISLLDPSGQSVESTTIALAPGAHTTRFVKADLFPDIADFRGSLDVASSGVNIAAVAMRQRSGSAWFSLVPGVNKLSHKLRFVFPQIFDGPAPEGTLQTTLILTNLSASQSANPTLTMTLDDGTPMTVNIPVLTGAASIPPSGTVFWQTDGLSPALASGAAVIQSDQPLAVTAVFTAFDSNGNALSESGATPSAVNNQFRIPFDQSIGVTAGATFLNTGARPMTLTLTLVDRDGVMLGTTQSNPLPAHGRLAGAISDFFPGATVTSGSILVSTATPVDLSLAAFNTRLGSMARSTAPALRIPVSPAGTPSTVTPQLDSAREVSADISTSGGSLAVTDSNGNTFTLTVPQGALLDHETITMTPISSATGISGPGLTAGVQLSPDGLTLMQPALLKIDLASAAPDGTFPIGWRGSSPGVYLNAPLNDPNSLTLVLSHFSGAGVGGFDVTSELLSVANQLDLVQSAAAYWAGQARQDALAGDDASSAIDNQKLLETLDIGFDTVLEPLIELATASDDPDVMRCAVTLTLSVLRQFQLIGLEDDPRIAAALDFINYCMQRWAAKLKVRCDNHDFSAFYEVLGALRQAALLGVEVDLDPSSCPPNLELDYKSLMTGDIPIGVTGNFSATISGKVTLTGSFTKDMLTMVNDRSTDLLTSFTLTGSAPESYDSITFNVNGVPPGCSETISAKTPDVMTVKPGQDPQLSQVQFKFNPAYTPQALTQNGQQLCSFCPVYQKKPLRVAIWMDPGKPSETLLSSCSGFSQTLTMYSWWTAWVTNHAAAGDNGYIESWTLDDTPSLFADKKITTTVIGSGGITLTENTTLMLKPPGQ
ncbi:MAG TPA: hypothetical protein VGL53_07160 [Bryobacteraceae bacterium]|jgi:hypothetical protein